MSTAGPSGWKPPEEVGFPKLLRINLPFWLYTLMSGVNGLFGSKSPLPNADWSLHTLQDVDLEAARVAEKRDTGWGIQP